VRISTLERCPAGSTTMSDAGLPSSWGILQLARPLPERSMRQSVGRLLASFLNLLRAQHLAMGAVAADFGPGQHDLKPEMRLDLAAQPLQRIAEELFYLAAAQADDVGVFLLRAG